MAQIRNIVVLTGAGISAESGLRTFRAADGLWEDHRVEDVATPEAFRRDPDLVQRFYDERRAQIMAAEPNAAHRALARLDREWPGELLIVTQNIDDLHERAGSTNVLHLHGEIFKMRSVRDAFTAYEIRGDIKLGDTAPDGSQLRPYIVWFEEPVPMIETAADIASMADIFVVVGTSLVVYPAAGLLNCAPGNIPKFIVDKQIPATGSVSNLNVIEAPATEGIPLLKKALKQLF